ncbi:hypothetical protein BDU57DRAFT_499918 [Ampelomyces quisqualis]|uniref:Uncharacterized protein n=1 Tax=Ampelomyces quisqualis TaxID=50730 RepID=A0A6A5QJT9_AMPQU|nr:hypothetical protein BDU57DRAFT_499918 [Ampelomyces quisqualis]
MLQHAPYKDISVGPVDENPQAVSFKIHIGFIRTKRRDGAEPEPPEDTEDEMPVQRVKQHKVWAYLYPARTPAASPEIHFHSFSVKGRYIGKEDGDKICKSMSGFAAAFGVPCCDKWSFSKLKALVKYYFLCRLAEKISENDANLMNYDIRITKTFKDNLVAVCREFQQGSERMSAAAPRVSAAGDSGSQDRTLSELPEGIFENDIVEVQSPLNVKSESSQPTNVPIQDARHDPTVDEKTMADLAELCSSEQAAEDELEKIKQEMEALEKRRVEKNGEREELKNRKRAAFQDMSAETAFILGHRLGCSYELIFSTSQTITNMVMLQAQHSLPHTPGTATAKENRSYANLCNELGEDLELLRYLPFKRATFQPQFELLGAADHRLLYGDMVDEKDQLWVYFTLVGGGQNYNKATGGTRMITFQTLKGAQNGEAPIRPQAVRDVALASGPFKMARDGFQIMAIAKYFFIKHGVDKHLQIPLSVATFKHDLIRACIDYRAIFKMAEAAKKSQAVTTAGTYGSAPSREASGAHISSRASSEMKRNRQPSQHSSEAPSTGASASKPQSSSRSSPSPVLNQLSQKATERFDSLDWEGLVDKYIEFQAEEEDLDQKIAQSEEERSNLAAQMVGLQARLDATTDHKSALMEEKYRIKAKKRLLQSSLSNEEQLEFCFEAGRRMGSKRVKRD